MEINDVTKLPKLTEIKDDDILLVIRNGVLNRIERKNARQTYVAKYIQGGDEWDTGLDYRSFFLLRAGYGANGAYALFAFGVYLTHTQMVFNAAGGTFDTRTVNSNAIFSIYRKSGNANIFVRNNKTSAESISIIVI